MKITIALAALSASAAGDLVVRQLADAKPICPGSPQPPQNHEHCDMTTEFPESCDKVMAEVKARVTGQNGWTDPHYQGSYSLLDGQGATITILRKSGANDGRGGGRYQDKIALTFSDTSSGGCSVGGCSDSQGASNNDQSTNFCNIRNLYCGSSDGCIVVQNDLTPKETLGLCPRHDANRCIASTAFDSTNPFAKKGAVGKYASNCPGSPAKDYESCAMQITFPGEDCPTVRNEMEARLNGEDNWVDPHNEGSYVVVAKDDTSMQVKRYSGKNDGQGGGRYMDLMNIAFAADTNGGCQVTACSDSQEESNNDQSTNYCNLRNLYKGTKNGGKPVNHDFKDYSEDVNDQQCPRHDNTRCN